MNVPNEPAQERPDVSWALLLGVALIVVGGLYQLRHNVFYTEGEVMEGLFGLLVWLVAGSTLLGFYRRKAAVWFILLVGGPLLLWQTAQARRWALLHEDIVALVRFAEDLKSNTGRYPESLEGYTFKTDWVKGHIRGFSSDERGEFRIGYFLNDPGISYWYSSRTGFGYYPD